jgi:peptide/nickel transport system permease protein|tara:strand:- start:3732 stop:4712 length:981 start_codon:yes stop_codon:yes gene_type:complete
MLVYIIKRILLFFPLIVGMAILVFSLQFMIPGDPAEVFLGQQASPEAVDKLREKLGLNKHPVVQLGMYMGRLLQGDLGTSIFQDRSVNKAVFERLPATIELAVCAIILATIIGVPLGVAAAIRKGSFFDVVCMAVGQMGVSVPVFWSSILLISFFSVKLGLLPSYGREMSLLSAIGSFFVGEPKLLWETIKHLMLPSFALGFLSMAYITRTTRSSMISVLKEDYIRTAKAKGLKNIAIVYSHALRNALIPVVSIMGLQLGALMGGAVLTETIFSWPGLGRLIVTAISERDYPLMQGGILVAATFFAVVNLVVDILYCVIDPRIRLK